MLGMQGQTTVRNANGVANHDKDTKMANVATLRIEDGHASPGTGLGSPRAGRAEPGNESSLGLVRRCIGGDESAFAELHRRYNKQILNYLNRMIDDRERAEDLVQDTFLRVYRHIRRFDQRRAFSSWIYSIANNLAKDELRRRARQPEWTASDLCDQSDGTAWPLEVEDPTSRPDDLYRRRALKAQVQEALQQLPERYRSVLVLRELQGKTYREISEITGWPLGSVRSRLNRGRARFAEIVAPLLD